MRAGRGALLVVACVAAGLWAGAGAGGAQETEPRDPAPAVARPDPATTGVVSGTIAFPAVQPRRRRRGRYPGQAPGSDANGAPSDVLPGVVYIEDVTGDPVTGVSARMEQEGIAFDPPVLPVRVGTTVAFPNLDPVYHNVLSYSTAKRFDLGRYAKGEARTVTFDQPGVVRLACEIHQQMRGFVVVLAQPHFVVTAGNRFHLEGVPPGTHRLALWHDRFTLEPVTVEVEAGRSTTVQLTAALAR
jgi:plastocyanin